jgi:hypothetical protein
VADRNPHGSAVERIGATRVEQNSSDSEGGCVAKKRAQVLVVVHTLDNRKQGASFGLDDTVENSRDQLASIRGREAVGDCDHPSMNVETDCFGNDFTGAEIHRCPCRQDRFDDVS